MAGIRALSIGFLWAANAAANPCILALTGGAQEKTPSQTIAIVDVASSAVDLVPAFQKEGFSVVHVESGNYPSFVQRGSRGIQFDAAIHFGEADAVTRLKNLNPRFVIAGTDPGLLLADKLAPDLTPAFANDPAKRDARRNKGFAYEALATAGLAHPRGGLAQNTHQALTIGRTIFSAGSTTVVVKPPASSGTDKVFYCENERQVVSAFEQIFQKPNSHGTISTAVSVTEWIDGQEYAVQFVSTVNPITGKVEHVPTDTWLYLRDLAPGGASRYDADYLLPSTFEGHDSLIVYGRQVLDTLGVRYGPSHLEIKRSKRGWVLIDPNIRMCGARLPRVVAQATGYSQIEGTVDAYLRPQSLLNHNSGYSLRSNAAVIFFRSVKDNGVFSHREIERLREKYGPTVIQEVSYQFPDGATVKLTRDSDSTLGQMTVVHIDPKVIESIRLEIRQAEEQGRLVR